MVKEYNPGTRPPFVQKEGNEVDFLLFRHWLQQIKSLLQTRMVSGTADQRRTAMEANSLLQGLELIEKPTKGQKDALNGLLKKTGVGKEFLLN